MWDSLVAVFKKELLHIVRDKGAFGLAITVPLFQMCMFGFIDQNVRDVPTVVVDQDRSAESRELIDKLRATRTFRIDRVASAVDEARTAIVAGRARVGVVIPPSYRTSRVRQENPRILVLIDGSDSTVSAQTLAAINGLAAADVTDLQAGPRNRKATLDVRPVILFNPDGRTANYIIPGLIAIILQMVAIALAAGAIVREREQGTFEQLLVTPLHPVGLMLGKIGPYLFFGIAEATLILAAMRFGFGVPIRGSLPFLFAIIPVYLIALLAMGLFLSTLARTQAQAAQLTQLFVMPSVFLSGYIFPTAGLPAPLYVLGQLLPPTHMVAIMRGIVLRDAGPRELLPEILTLVAMSVVLVWWSVRSFRKLKVLA